MLRNRGPHYSAKCPFYILPPPRKASGILGADASKNINETFTFNLRNKEEGNAHISGTSALDVRHIPTNVKRSWPTARALYRFKIER